MSLPIELQFWRFNPNKVWPNFVRKGALLFDTSEQPDKESTCKLGWLALERIAIPALVIAHFDTSRSLITMKFFAIATELASVIFQHPSRFSSSSVPPCILTKAETMLAIKFQQPMRFTLTSPASQFCKRGRRPTLVML